MNMQSALTFGEELKSWRKVRRLSQLDLALQAGVSQRHVSFLESGKSAPSREMVTLLAGAMSLPARARDTMLLTAGYAPASRAKGMDDPTLAPAREALDFVLERMEPYPALALSRDWRILTTNAAMQRLSSFLITGSPKGGPSLADIDYMDALTNPDGLRGLMTHGEGIMIASLDAMLSEAAAERDDERMRHVRSLRARFPAVAPPLEPLPMLGFARDGWTLNFVTIMTSFAAPCDASLEGIKIELLYPGDGGTRSLLDAWVKDEAAGSGLTRRRTPAT